MPHCDISTAHILLRSPSVLGHRGVLADLDMAVELNEGSSNERSARPVVRLTLPTTLSPISDVLPG